MEIIFSKNGNVISKEELRKILSEVKECVGVDIDIWGTKENPAGFHGFIFRMMDGTYLSISDRDKRKWGSYPGWLDIYYEVLT